MPFPWVGKGRTLNGSHQVQHNEDYGMFEVAVPTSRDRVIDIVAVHGLGGHRKDTWTTDTGKFWLQDYLPKQLEGAGINARIMSYGYDSSTAFSSSVANITVQAVMLLEVIKSKRGPGLEKRPIVFIAHSLGGIVVKKAMIMAHSREPTWGQLLDNIKAVAFFGVPHRGSDVAYWGSFAAHLIRFAELGLGTNVTYVDALKRNSETFRDISAQFVNRAEKLRIRTFFETAKMHGQLIVDEDSATLGLPNELAVGVINSTHKTVCKFDNETWSQKYEPVWTGIVELIKPILTSGLRHVKAGAIESHNQDRKADRWNSLWADSKTKRIKFSAPHEEPPRVLISLSSLNFGKEANLRAHASIVDITPVDFRPALEHWSDTRNYAMRGHWLALAPGDADFQSGSQSTFGFDKKHRRTPGVVTLSRYIKFYKPYKDAPDVVCWFTHIDSSNEANHRARVEATDITKEGFLLSFETWWDSVLFELEATWLAFSKDRRDIYCVPQIRIDSKAQSHEVARSFPAGMFHSPPSCFVGLNYLDLDCTKQTRVQVVVDKVTPTSAAIIAGSWSDSRVFEAGFVFIAVDADTGAH